MPFPIHQHIPPGGPSSAVARQSLPEETRLISPDSDATCPSSGNQWSVLRAPPRTLGRHWRVSSRARPGASELAPARWWAPSAEGMPARAALQSSPVPAAPHAVVDDLHHGTGPARVSGSSRTAAVSITNRQKRAILGRVPRGGHGVEGLKDTRMEVGHEPGEGSALRSCWSAWVKLAYHRRQLSARVSLRTHVSICSSSRCGRGSAPAARSASTITGQSVRYCRNPSSVV